MLTIAAKGGVGDIHLLKWENYKTLQNMNRIEENKNVKHEIFWGWTVSANFYAFRIYEIYRIFLKEKELDNVYVKLCETQIVRVWVDSVY